ncbi:MAG: serine O-acetyltransferase [Actinomycetia bacterium]|nr:serine O-acetyltransferase [Actinomycetes bacterium]MCH9800471.1 serine O-acetyltransferase [Actinomycetes bacterium]
MGKFGENVRTVQERDPAARNKFEIVLAYPGLHALWGHRLANWLWRHRLRTMARLWAHFVRFLTGVEIHPGATLGRRVFIDHGMGVVIGETAIVEDDCSIYQGATLGGTSLNKGKRHPTLCANVVVGAGAKVLGPVTVSENARIGANAVVLHDIPAGTVVVGVPGQVVTRTSPATPPVSERENDVPDAVGSTLVSLLRRVESLERSTSGEVASGPHAPEDGIWRGEDFADQDFVI